MHRSQDLRTVACLWSCGIDNLATIGDCLLHFTQRNAFSNEIPEGELSDGLRAAAEPLTMSPWGSFLDSNISGAIEQFKRASGHTGQEPWLSLLGFLGTAG